MKISTLTIEMAANVARLRQDMDKAQKTVDKAMGGITKAAKVAGGALAALGVGLSVSAVAGWVRGAINAADQMTKLAQKTGLAVTEVAGIQLAFRQSGVEATQLVPIMAKLSNAAVNGSEAFKAMGLQARNNDGTLKTTRQLLGEVAEKFAGYQEGAAKTALAVKLFGEEGAKLLPLLNQGAEGLAAYDETARRLGLTIDEQTGKAAERFNDTLDLVGQGTQGVARMIAAEMLPTLEGLAGHFLRTMTEGDRLRNTAGFLGSALKSLVVVALGVAEVFDTIGTTFGGLAAAAVAAATGNFRQAWSILKDLKTDIGTGWQQTLDDMTKAWNASGDAGVAALVATGNAAKLAAPEVQKVAAAAKSGATEFERWMQSMIGAEDAYRQTLFKQRLEMQAAEELAHSDWLKGLADDEDAYRWNLFKKRLEAEEKAAADYHAAQVKAAEEAAREWQKASDKIEDMLTDALMRGFESGKGFGENLADSIVNMFKTFVAREIAKAITQAIMAALAQTQWARFISAAMGGGGTGMNAGSMMSMAGGGSSYMGALASSGSALWAGATGTMSAANVGGTLAANYATAGMATGTIASSGTGMNALLATNAAYGTAGAAGAGAGAAGGAGAATSFLGSIPVWGWIALAAVVFWDDLFGRKLKEAGSMLSIRGDEITSSGFEFRKGGLFRSDKWTDTGDRTAQDQELIQQFRNVQQSSAAMAQALGYSADTINGFTGTVRVNMKGVKTAQEAQQRLNEALEDFQWQLWRSVPGMDMSKEKFKEMMAQVQQSIQQAGISAESMADIITAGMLGRMSQAQVGEALANQVLGGIYQTIASPFANQIAQAFQAQIITPVFTAILAGVPISQAISQQAIANVVATAQQAAATLNAIFSDAGFRQAIGEIQTAISGISAAAVQPARSVRGLTSSFNAAGNAAGAARQAWRALTDSIIEEIRRLRGEVAGDGSMGLGFAQSQFAIATAQARAGDRDAAARLPELSRNVEDLLRLNSGSFAEFAQGQATLLASLTETAQFLNRRFRLRIPGFAVGTDYVPRDMLAMIHEGEQIVPKAYNPNAGGSGGNAALVTELQSLRSEVQGLRIEVRAGVGHQAQSAKVLTRALAREGDAFTVREAEE